MSLYAEEDYNNFFIDPNALLKNEVPSPICTVMDQKSPKTWNLELKDEVAMPYIYLNGSKTILSFIHIVVRADERCGERVEIHMDKLCESLTHEYFQRAIQYGALQYGSMDQDGSMILQYMELDDSMGLKETEVDPFDVTYDGTSYTITHIWSRKNTPYQFHFDIGLREYTAARYDGSDHFKVYYGNTVLLLFDRFKDHPSLNLLCPFKWINQNPQEIILQERNNTPRIDM